MSRKTAGDERKTARVSLLLTPKMFADVATLAQIKQVSLNDLFTSLVAQAVAKNQSAIEKVQVVLSEVSPTVDLNLTADG